MSHAARPRRSFKRRSPTKRTTVVYFRGIDQDTKDQFKAWCARRGTSMTAQVERFMSACVRGRFNDKDVDNVA